MMEFCLLFQGGNSRMDLQIVVGLGVFEMNVCKLNIYETFELPLSGNNNYVLLYQHIGSV